MEEAAVVTLAKLVASSRPTSADVPVAVSAAVELTCGANKIWRAPRRKFHISRRQVKSEHPSSLQTRRLKTSLTRYRSL